MERTQQLQEQIQSQGTMSFKRIRKCRRDTLYTPPKKKRERENADYDNTKPTHLNSINHMKTIKKKETAMPPICIHSFNARRSAI